MICAARNVRFQALCGMGKQLLKTHGVFCFKTALFECCYLRVSSTKPVVVVSDCSQESRLLSGFREIIRKSGATSRKLKVMKRK